MRTLSCLIVILSLAGPAWAQAYELELTRRLPVGTTYRVAATGSIERSGTRTAAGRVEPVPGQTMNVTLRATAKVAGVTPDGRTDRIEYKIDRCAAAMNGGESRDLVPPGKTLIARQDGDVLTFEIEGVGVIRDARRQALSTVIRLPTARAKFDETYGPGRPVRAGESWRINETAYRRELKQTSFDPESGKVEGGVKLADVADAPGGKLFTVQGDVKSTGLRPLAPPDELGPQRSDVSLAVAFAIAAPSDVRRPIVSERGSSTMTMRLTGDGPNGQPMVINAVIRQTLQLTRTPIE